MKVVIDIPSGFYKNIERIKKGFYGSIASQNILNAVANGTPLPKGYGNLIDKDKLLDELEKTVKSVDDTNKHFLSWDRAVAHVHLSKPIIKADGGGEDES